MPLILAEAGGLVFVSDEASVTTTVEVMRPEVVAAAGSPTREVRRVILRRVGTRVAEKSCYEATGSNSDTTRLWRVSSSRHVWTLA